MGGWIHNPEEKILLRFWFLMDHGVTINQKLVNLGVLQPEFDLWEFLNQPSREGSNKP